MSMSNLVWTKKSIALIAIYTLFSRVFGLKFLSCGCFSIIDMAMFCRHSSVLPPLWVKMPPRVRTYETDHPYAMQSWEGRFPQIIPGDDVNDVLRVRAPKAYWLSLEANFPDYQNKDGYATLDVLRRDLNGTNGCPLLGESFRTRVKRTIWWE